jgi:hypothetical protein
MPMSQHGLCSITYPSILRHSRIWGAEEAETFKKKLWWNWFLDSLQYVFFFLDVFRIRSYCALDCCRKDRDDLLRDRRNATHRRSLDSPLYVYSFSMCLGYGHIAPKTAVGKIVTIFYAIVGMPLTVLCWSNIGAAMANAFRLAINTKRIGE